MTVESVVGQSASSDAVAARPCPFCQTAMPEQVSLCGACGRFSRPISVAQPVEPKQSIIERANIVVAKWETEPQIQQRLKWTHDALTFNLPRWLRLGLGTILLLLGGAMSLLWLRYGGWTQVQAAFALFVAGASLLFGNRVLRPNGKPVVPTNRPSNDASIRLFGYDLNIALLQSAALASMIVWAFLSEVDKGWYAGLAVIVLTPLLRGTTRFPTSLALCAIGFLYVAYLWSVHDIVYSIRASQDALAWSASWPTLFWIGLPYLWTLLLVALVPQLLVACVGRIGFGRFRGDTSIQLFGSDVPIAAGSSLILVSAALALKPFLFAFSWVPTAITGL